MKIRQAVGVALVGATIATVMILVPKDDPAPSSSPTERQVQTALMHCSQVWVEHKIRPNWPDEVLARGCDH